MISESGNRPDRLLLASLTKSEYSRSPYLVPLLCLLADLVLDHLVRDVAGDADLLLDRHNLVRDQLPLVLILTFLVLILWKVDLF